MQVDELKREAVAASHDFSSRMRQLETENGQLKQQYLQLKQQHHQQQQHQQQAVQAAVGAHHSASSKQQQHDDMMKSLELAYVEQQKFTALASASQSECNLLKQQLITSSSAMTALQDTVNRQERQIELQLQQIQELQSHVEKERIQAAAAIARASASDAEMFQISRAAMAAAAVSETEMAKQQQNVLNLQELLEKK